VVAVAIVFAVRLVVLAVIAHDIRKREAVMGGNEVDARPGPASALVKDVARPQKSGRETLHHAFVALPEAAHGVTILVVPLGPAGRMIAKLVAVRTGIPGFRDQLYLGQNRVLAH